MKQKWLKATLLCGALDIGYAVGLTALRGNDIGDMLRGVASGPLGDSAQGWGISGAIAGLAVHFSLMAIMVAVYLLAARLPAVAQINPWIAGLVYGVGLYLVMYGLVLPMRFGAPFPPPDLGQLALSLFPHIALVGWPLAFIARKEARPRIKSGVDASPR